MSLNLGVVKPVFTGIKTKAVHKTQRWLNKGSDMLVYRKTDDLEDYYFHFLLASTSDTQSK